MFDNGTLVCALILLIFCIVSCRETNVFIEKHHSDEPHGTDRKAPVFLLGVVAVMILVSIVLPNTDPRYEELKDEKETLEYEYDELKEKIKGSYDSSLALKFYVMGYDKVDKETALESVKDLYDRFYPEEWID